MKQLSVCVIIPTKNRPHDLERALDSLLAQTVVPQSLVIIDQSVGPEGRLRVERQLASAKGRGRHGCRLTYVHDPRISGGAVARNRGMELADGDIWLFLDDDVVLEEDFVQQLLKVYRDYPNADGISGLRPIVPGRRWHSFFGVPSLYMDPFETGDSPFTGTRSNCGSRRRYRLTGSPAV